MDVIELSSKYPWREKEKRGFYRNTVSNVMKIYDALKNAHMNGADFLSVSEIARITGLHKWTVSRTIDLWMTYLVEPGSSKKNAKSVRLMNPNLTAEEIKNIIKIKL